MSTELELASWRRLTSELYAAARSEDRTNVARQAAKSTRQGVVFLAV